MKTLLYIHDKVLKILPRLTFPKSRLKSKGKVTKGKVVWKEGLVTRNAYKKNERCE